jgi:hypothetical protein
MKAAADMAAGVRVAVRGETRHGPPNVVQATRKREIGRSCAKDRGRVE